MRLRVVVRLEKLIRNEVADLLAGQEPSFQGRREIGAHCAADRAHNPFMVSAAAVHVAVRGPSGHSLYRVYPCVVLCATLGDGLRTITQDAALAAPYVSPQIYW